MEAKASPAAGTLQNLGLAEWRRGRVGPAILAWEQSLWIDPFQKGSRENLRFARKSAQLEAPDSPWYEVVASWLPANWWGWLASVCGWLAIGMTLLPVILWRRKKLWPQAIAAFCLAVLLLCLPALFGVHTRGLLGFVLKPEAPLRLTPTTEGQVTHRLSAGEPARLLRHHGNYLFVRTPRGNGWLESANLGWLIGPVAP